MKTSNKILLSIFLTGVVVLSSFFLAVFAKIKSGEMKPFERIREGRYHDVRIPQAKYISIMGFRSCRVAPGDETKLRIFDMPGSALSYTLVHDTLIVKADSSITDHVIDQNLRSVQPVIFYLPSAMPVYVYSSDVIVEGGADASSAPSWPMELKNASVMAHNDRTGHNQFDSLKIKASESRVEFNEQTHFNKLNIQLTRSFFINFKARIDQLQIQTDDNSTITLTGKSAPDMRVIKME